MNCLRRLEKGDTVGIICPSSPISKEKVEICQKVIENFGYKVKKADNLTSNLAGYMAGDGETRGKWINKMFSDTDVKAIFCIRGGDGGNRTIEYLDLELIKNNPKIFLGYSDITNFHLIFNQICKFSTFHGPMVSSNMIDNFDDESRKSLFQALNERSSYEFINPDGYEFNVLKDGKAEGILTGGNLSILTASMGTFYELDTKGKILFIEEIKENMSHIDRMVYQLRNSGKLKECAGIILGQFTNCINEDMPEYGVLDVFKDALEGIDIPVMYNIQSGHGSFNMTLPLGAECSIDTNNKKIYFDNAIK
jgi:muramoyltetrapeptide carboxypeptidase